MLRPIAALLGSAVEHWQIWDTERRRQGRLDRMEALLGTLAQSLDVREVFQRLSEGMQPILAHDLMVLTELDVKSRMLRVAAHAGPEDLAPPVDSIELTEPELLRRIDFEVIRDIPAEFEPATERARLILSSGFRSWVRVPVWISGEVKGGLSFFHKEPARFDWKDAEVTARLADRISLALSLQ